MTHEAAPADKRGSMSKSESSTQVHRVRGLSVDQANAYYNRMVREAKKDSRIWTRPSAAAPKSQPGSAPEKKSGKH